MFLESSKVVASPIPQLITGASFASITLASAGGAGGGRVVSG